MKKIGAIRYDRNWVEIFFLAFLVIGFWISLSTQSAFVNYVIIIFCGIISGRIIYQRKGLFKFTYILIIIGFLLGYIFGAFHGDKTLIVILFILSNIVSYIAHMKKVI